MVMRFIIALLLLTIGASPAGAVIYLGTFICDDGEHDFVMDFHVKRTPGGAGWDPVRMAGITYDGSDNPNLPSVVYRGGGSISPREEVTVTLFSRGHVPPGLERLAFAAKLRGPGGLLQGTMTTAGCTGEIRAVRVPDVGDGDGLDGVLRCSGIPPRGMFVLVNRRPNTHPELNVYYVATYATEQSPGVPTSAYKITAVPHSYIGARWETRTTRGTWLGAPGVRRDGFWIRFLGRSAFGAMKAGLCGRFELRSHRVRF
jgi:hypothetical protein